ncbi:T9SS type A sorting domain-containing protein [Portibacter marinus]|uniref:T9SS type A sorting domain-containing protein n=1 Tax=Portibacter marinus TaxID=2898660 RepID=UPI001F2641DE|nr:T9SS type A sorting domain-containing protein [Portibacter marinus]
MKIIPPTQECIRIVLALIIWILPFFLEAQCTDCPNSDDQTLLGCDDDNDNDAVFDLTEVTLSDPGNTAGYYDKCTGSGNLNSNDTINNPSNYTAQDGDIIYVSEFDGNTCVQILRVRLNFSDLSVSISSSAPSVCPNGTVTITATPSNEEGDVTYSWAVPSGQSNPGDVSSFSASKDGAYIVSVTDDVCSAESSALNIMDGDFDINLTTENATCAGGSDGTITVTIPGGSGDYKFDLSNGTTVTEESPYTFTGLPTGNYNVTATQIAAPMCSKTSGTFNVGNGRTVTMTLNGTDPTTVGGTDGEIDVTVSGGTSTYAWSWTRTNPPGSSSGGTSNSSSFTIDNLLAGEYTVTVMDDSDSPPGCTVVEDVTLNSVVCTIDVGGAIPVSPDCRNGDNGSITVDVDNFIGAYNIEWSGPESGNDNNETGSTYTINNLSPGTYSITVTDAANCTDDISSVNVANPPSLTFSASQLRASCEGADNGAIRVSNISNGDSPYQISWSGPDNGTSNTSSSTFDIINLEDGSYSITVTDDNDCSATANNVVVGVLPEVNVDIVGDLIFCAEEGSGSLSTSPGGFSSYDWSTGASSSSISIPNPGNTDDVYRVTVTDSDGCTGSDVVQVVALNAISVSLNNGASKTSVTCSSDCDGRIDINVSGGNGSYTYSWSGPGNPPNIADISNLCPGEYNLTVTDGEGCIGTFSRTITVPDEIEAVAIATEVTCHGDNDGRIELNVQGGTAPYDYDWSSPITQNTATVTNVSAGNYTVTITDDNNCSITESVTVTEPQEVIGTITPNNAEICIGKEITLKADGGTSYQWSAGLGNSAEVTVSPGATITYSVTVTDANTKGCTDVASKTVTVNPLPNVNINISESSGNANNDGTICEGDEITLTATGGTSYNWTGGNPNPYKFSPDPGTSTYRVTVTDNNGCVNTDSEEVTVNVNPQANFVFNMPTQIVGDPQRIVNQSEALCGQLVSCQWVIDENPNQSDCEGVSPTFNSQGNKNILLTVENSCGCTDQFTNVLDIGASNQCAIENFTINGNELIACVDQEVPFIAVDRDAGGECMITSREYRVFRNGNEMTLGNQFQIQSDHFIFKETGEFEITYTINDNVCGCIKSAARFLTILPPPDIGFATDNPSQGCSGQTLNIKFADFDDNDRVGVEFENGEIFYYENNNFDFAPSGTGITTLEIISVDIGTCEVPVNNEKIDINILPEFRIVDEVIDDECDENLKFTYVVEVAGGDPNAPLTATGIEGGITSGNRFQLNNLDPGVPYDFTLTKGNTCDPIEISIFKAQCDCFFEPGSRLVRDLIGCEGAVFDISNVFTTMTDSSEYDPEIDTFFYALHLSGGDGQTLGTVHRILPANTQTLDSDFPLFVAGVNYKLSAVGVKKASLEAGEIVLDLSNPLLLSNKGRSQCFSVVGGTNVKWEKVPTPEIRTLGNVTSICKNANDFAVFVGNPTDGTDIEFSVIGLDNSNVKTYGSQDTAYIYFEDNGQDSFQVVVRESAAFDGNSFSCEGRDTITLYVRDDAGAPPLSKIILWPGNILASTADSTTTCFEWRLYRQGTFSSILSTDKYFFADKDADIISGNDIYFVDTYFCDNPDCVTRVFFNNDRPLPGLNYQEQETYQYLIHPNPNNGLFEISLFSEVNGNFRFDLIDVTGNPIMNRSEAVNRSKNKIEFDVRNVPKGIYFLRIVDMTSKTSSIDKVVIH